MIPSPRSCKFPFRLTSRTTALTVYIARGAAIVTGAAKSRNIEVSTGYSIPGLGVGALLTDRTASAFSPQAAIARMLRTVLGVRESPCSRSNCRFDAARAKFDVARQPHPPSTDSNRHQPTQCVHNATFTGADETDLGLEFAVPYPQKRHEIFRPLTMTPDLGYTWPEHAWGWPVKAGHLVRCI